MRLGAVIESSIPSASFVRLLSLRSHPGRATLTHSLTRLKMEGRTRKNPNQASLSWNKKKTSARKPKNASEWKHNVSSRLKSTSLRSEQCRECYGELSVDRSQIFPRIGSVSLCMKSRNMDTFARIGSDTFGEWIPSNTFRNRLTTRAYNRLQFARTSNQPA